ncbi:aminopeptidase [Arthrobacter burdickii]|uniref:Aminopeptidase n=1 Tax=Arthrobacter burdickii TaxID=3035920 RepID=A0ABT8K449_9MICC|nr:aminopeptidase [Arthrobacter burdickii]MDN4612216.1 aminopeptidase [Arthrobacter burdickii]
MTADHRWALLAAQVAGGTGVRHGSRVSVFMTDPQVMPAVEAFVEECYRLGACPQVLATDERFDRIAVAHAPVDMLSAPAPLELASMHWADVHVSFRGMVAPTGDDVDEVRLAAQRRGKGLVSTARWEETAWSLVRVPTPEWAELIGVGYVGLLDEFFAGCLAPWSELRARWDMLCAALGQEDTVRVVAGDTDLTFRTRGRTWISFAGEANLPDGEIATAPLDDGVDGHIRFPGTFWFAGSPITELELRFEGGTVVEASAARGEGFVRELLDTDAGSRRVGELGIGTNPGMTTATGDLLIDEKILGTMHLALGRAYPDCGGINQSSLHWDIVKDLRKPGSFLSAGDHALIADGEVTGLLAEHTRPATLP